jgi:hypothetical protein
VATSKDAIFRAFLFLPYWHTQAALAFLLLGIETKAGRSRKSAVCEIDLNFPVDQVAGTSSRAASMVDGLSESDGFEQE